jgi:hypothetical protein
MARPLAIGLMRYAAQRADAGLESLSQPPREHARPRLALDLLSVPRPPARLGQRTLVGVGGASCAPPGDPPRRARAHRTTPRSALAARPAVRGNYRFAASDAQYAFSHHHLLLVVSAGLSARAEGRSHQRQEARSKASFIAYAKDKRGLVRRAGVRPARPPSARRSERGRRAPPRCGGAGCTWQLARFGLELPS